MAEIHSIVVVGLELLAIIVAIQSLKIDGRKSVVFSESISHHSNRIFGSRLATSTDQSLRSTGNTTDISCRGFPP